MKGKFPNISLWMNQWRMDGYFSKANYQLSWIVGNSPKIPSFVDDVLDKIEVFQEKLIGLGIEKVIYFFDTIQFSKMVKHHSTVCQ